jgi:hypothetical protein
MEGFFCAKTGRKGEQAKQNKDADELQLLTRWQTDKAAF